VRVPPRRSDDADVIRARLRVLLAEGSAAAGWLPDGGPPADPGPGDLAGSEDATGSGDATGPADAGEPAAATGVPGVAVGRHRAPGSAVRLAPGRTGVWALAAAGLVAVLVLLVWTWWDRPTVTPAPPPAPASPTAQAAPAARTGTASAGPGAPVVGEAAATSATVVVSVVGLVAHPGLVTLPTGARVADAVTAAGGFVAPADPASVNLAAVVADGQQIAVGVPGAGGAPAATGTSGGAAAGSTAGAGPVDLNVATVAALDGLPGIGPVLAQRIVDFRTQHGRFTSVDQLDDVPGIGPALYARLAGQVRV
jgi:competence protein ComEA